MNILRPVVTAIRSSASVVCRVQAQNLKSVEQGLTSLVLTRCLHTSPKLASLDEFFDDPANYTAQNIYVGRPWRMVELRKKSNDDLHKLWYVLIKERNMLMTMEQMTYEQGVAFPGPDRIFKVEESMENIMGVIKERDVAYNILNFNKTGLPTKRVVRNFAGIPILRTEQEHAIPKSMNKYHNLLFPKYRKWMKKFIVQYEQKLRKKVKYNEHACKRKQRELLREFPHLTLEDVEHIQASDKNLKKFLKMSENLNDQDFKQRKVY